MRKIIFFVCFLGSAGLYGSVPMEKKEKSWLELQEEKSSKEFSGIEEQCPEFTTASDQVKIEILRGAFANGRAWWDLMKVAQSIKLLTQPKTLGLIALGAVGIFAGWHATALAADVAKHYILIPPLAEKTSIRSWSSRLKDVFVHEERLMPERSHVILNDELSKHIEMLTKSVINTAKNDTLFRHYLFYGPPGTGKTMIAMAMANEAGLEYMYFSAAALNKFSLEEGVKQINHLFEFAKAYPKKLMIIMDEADSIFAHRDTCPDKTRTFLNQILTYTGTEQNNYVVIAMTNRPKDFDSAALSRFGEKIKIDAPGHEERKKIFTHYGQKYFFDSHALNRDKRSVLQWLFSRKPIIRLPLIVSEEVLSDETLNELAVRSEGLVGREIADIMLMVQNAAYSTPDQMLTKEVLISGLENKKKQLNILMNDFAQEASAAA